MRVIASLTILAMASGASVFAQQRSAAEMPPGPVLEIRSYNLKKGMRDNFHQLFLREALPLLRRSQIDVVAYGPSRHDRDSYFLMRAFASLEARERVEDAFYSSSEWRNGPRAAVLAAIDTYTTVVIGVDDATLDVLRNRLVADLFASESRQRRIASHDGFAFGVAGKCFDVLESVGSARSDEVDDRLGSALAVAEFR